MAINNGATQELDQSSEGETDEGSTVDAGTIEKAKASGWAPKENYRGDPEKWVDADVWVERADSIMPILQKSNKKLEGELGATRAENARLSQQIKETQESVEALKEFHEESLKRAKAQARTAVLREIKEARAEGDVDAEMDALDRLSEMKAEEAPPAGKKKTATTEEETPPPRGKDDPEMQAWAAANPELMGDVRKLSLMNAEMIEMRKDGDRRTGKAFLDDALDRVSKYLGTPARGRPNRVGSTQNGTGDGGGAGGKTYNDLPREAKDACTKQTAKMVGKGKAFEKAADWQKYYADTFFSEE